MPLNLQQLDYQKIIHDPEQIPNLIQQSQTQLKQLPKDRSSQKVLQVLLNLKMIQTVLSLRRFPFDSLQMAHDLNQQQIQNAQHKSYPSQLASLYFQDQLQSDWIKYFDVIHQNLLSHSNQFQAGVHQTLKDYRDMIILPFGLNKFFDDHRVSLLDLANRNATQIKDLVHYFENQTIKPDHYKLNEDPIAFLDNFRWVKQIQHHLWMKNWHYFNRIKIDTVPQALMNYFDPTKK